MNEFLNNYKTKPCSNHCKNPHCIYYHSAIDYRRLKINYLPFLCIDAIQNDFCIHKNCKFCSNYFEFKYHPENYKKKECVFSIFNKNCELNETCPDFHKNKIDIIQKTEKLSTENAHQIKKVVQNKEEVCTKSLSSRKLVLSPTGIQNKIISLEEKKKIAEIVKEIEIKSQEINLKPFEKKDLKVEKAIDPEKKFFFSEEFISAQKIENEWTPESPVHGNPAKSGFKYILGKELSIYEDRKNEFKGFKGLTFDMSFAVDMISVYVSAYLNTEGGTLYYGISDNGVVTGVHMIRKSRDLFMQSLDGCLNKFSPPLSPELYSVNFVNVVDKSFNVVNDKYVIEIDVKKGDPSKVYFNHKNEAYVKRDSSVSQLKGSFLVEFATNKLSIERTI